MAVSKGLISSWAFPAHSPLLTTFSISTRGQRKKQQQKAAHWDANAFSNEKGKFHAILSRQAALFIAGVFASSGKATDSKREKKKKRKNEHPRLEYPKPDPPTQINADLYQ